MGNQTMTYVDYSENSAVDARLDKLERNRISARKCRAKRKNAARETEIRVNNLMSENSALLLENQRLQALLNRAGIPLTTVKIDFTTPVDGGASQQKRAKYDTGVNDSHDSSESAVFAMPRFHSSSETPAQSPQLDSFPLAILIISVCLLRTAMKTPPSTTVSTPRTICSTPHLTQSGRTSKSSLLALARAVLAQTATALLKTQGSRSLKTSQTFYCPIQTSSLAVQTTRNCNWQSKTHVTTPLDSFEHTDMLLWDAPNIHKPPTLQLAC